MEGKLHWMSPGGFYQHTKTFWSREMQADAYIICLKSIELSVKYNSLTDIEFVNGE